MATEQLSGTIVVIIIAIGVQGCIMLIIFAKRQITRFALRSRRGPHTSLCQGAPKFLRRDVDRYLDYIPAIRFEPNTYAHPSSARSRALHALFALEVDISAHSPKFKRHPGSNVRSYLVKCAASGPLSGVDVHQVHVACDLVERARHDYRPFGEEQLEAFLALVADLREALGRNRSVQPGGGHHAYDQHHGRRANRRRTTPNNANCDDGAALIQSQATEV